MPQNKIKVLHIASGDLWAGAEVQLFTLVKALQNQGISVTVALMNNGKLQENLEKNKFNVIVLDESKLNSFQILLRLIRLIKNLKPDVVHTHRTKENILGSIAAMLLGIPSMRTVHGAPEHVFSWFTKPYQKMYSLLDKLAANYVQKRIVAVSEDLKLKLSKIFRDSKLLVIENGIDLQYFEKYSSITTNPCSHNSVKIGFVGRLVPVKRADIFIQIASYLRQNYNTKQLQFHIYGDGPLRPKLEKMAAEFNVSDIVHFEGQIEDVIPQIATLDVLLITSDHEGLPMTLLEAMLLKIPVVAHAIGGIANASSNGQGAWLVNDNTVQNMSNTLINCISADKPRNEKIKFALQNVQNNYSSDTSATAYINVYQSLIC